MNGLDGRHRWEVTERKGAHTTHTCRVCGRTETFEHIIPDALIGELAQLNSRPNPLRALFQEIHQ